MGYVTVLDNCLACNSLFTFNPNLVPSKFGRPVCERCMRIVNRKRVDSGIPPFTIHPRAYMVEPEENIDWGDD